MVIYNPQDLEKAAPSKSATRYHGLQRRTATFELVEGDVRVGLSACDVFALESKPRDLFADQQPWTTERGPASRWERNLAHSFLNPCCSPIDPTHTSRDCQTSRPTRCSGVTTLRFFPTSPEHLKSHLTHGYVQWHVLCRGEWLPAALCLALVVSLSALVSQRIQLKRVVPTHSENKPSPFPPTAPPSGDCPDKPKFLSSGKT